MIIKCENFNIVQNALYYGGETLKKKIIISILSVAIVIVACCGVYIVSGSSAKAQDLRAYLESKGYAASEIRDISIKHSFASLFLGYAEWAGYVEFENEIGIIYHYSFIDGISQGSFSGYLEVYGNLEKEELLEKLKHLER